MSDTTPLPEGRTIPWHWIVLGSLVAAQAVVGAYLNPYSGRKGTLAMLLLGTLDSQPVLFAFWTAFGPQRLHRRALCSFLLCTLVLFVRETRLVDVSAYGPGCVMMLSLSDFATASILLLIIRRLLRWQMTCPFLKDSHSVYKASQFGIKHLIALITIAALACGLIRWLFMMKPDLPSLPSAVEFAFANVCATILFLPSIVVAWLVMAYRPTIRLIWITVIAVAAANALATWIMATRPSAPRLDAYGAFRILICPFFVMQLGAALSIVVTTLVMRFCGFRMVRLPRAAR